MVRECYWYSHIKIKNSMLDPECGKNSEQENKQNRNNTRNRPKNFLLRHYQRYKFILMCKKKILHLFTALKTLKRYGPTSIFYFFKKVRQKLGY